MSIAGFGNSGRDVTIRDVARAAGVSVGTVSRVLNNHPSVRTPMREAVQHAVRELGYEPNELARQLRASRTHAIAILVDDVIHSMNGYAVHGADEAAHARGYSVLVGETMGDEQREMELVRSMFNRRAEGLVCLPRYSRAAIAEEAQKAGVPIVFFGQVTPREGTLSTIIDERQATIDAIDDLVRYGHRHIGLIGDQRPFIHRRIAEISAVLHNACPAGARVTPLVTALDEMPGATAELMTRSDRPTAAVVLTHRCVPLVLKGIRKAELAMPDDLSLVAFGDSEWAEVGRPALNVISAPYQEHVAVATNLLIDLIEGKSGSDPLPAHASQYIPRESVGAVPSPP